MTRDTKKIASKTNILRAHSTYQSKEEKTIQEPNDSSLSMGSKDSGIKKSCLKNTEEKKSSRKESLNGAKVRFGRDVGNYTEAEEEAKILENKRKYKKGS